MKSQHTDEQLSSFHKCKTRLREVHEQLSSLGSSRKLSLAMTKVEEAQLWLGSLCFDEENAEDG